MREEDKNMSEENDYIEIDLVRPACCGSISDHFIAMVIWCGRVWL